MAKKSEDRYTYGAAARRRKKNRRKYTFYYFTAAILMLAVGATLALTVFFSFWISGKVVWQVFVAVLPVMCVVYLVLNSVWGKGANNLYVISALLWTLLLFFYVLFLKHNLWLLFLLGVPAQAAVVLAFKIRLTRWFK